MDQARRGTLAGMVQTGATFADAAAEYLRYVELARGRKPSTLRGYRSTIDVHLLPAFGELPVEAVTTLVIEGWLAAFKGSVRSSDKVLIQLGGIIGRAKKVDGLPANAASDVEKFPQRASGGIDVFSPEEVWALVRAAADEQDGAVFLSRWHSPAGGWASCSRCAGPSTCARIPHRAGCKVIAFLSARDAHAWRRQRRSTRTVDARISRPRLDGGTASQRADGAVRTTRAWPSVSVGVSNGRDDLGRLHHRQPRSELRCCFCPAFGASSGPGRELPIR